MCLRFQSPENSKTDANASGQVSEHSPSLSSESTSIDICASTDRSEGQSVITDSIPNGEQLDIAQLLNLCNVESPTVAIRGDPMEDTIFSENLVPEDLNA
mmetsp:Transcript_4031/g.6552  ORF Transcript_4031/g.6552 Transcript_4031/m.6552 type:complete len:100 (-) Transcript_4031:744-1043(-)|eukprot:CAMPEP_0169087140 /NCGR_PEP_ID=MMETSP1015-20121227/14075_1 /TAXON_ID=342587 /ORGANISM="Karlodinium micrum, Strain CCMP2283" /LENGTH=99 /DNA_ID=CAMNT_0009147355 /DNA_START=391 /DNA_END=690 /DNA_ORIENTATION=-